VQYPLIVAFATYWLYFRPAPSGGTGDTAVEPTTGISFSKAVRVDGKALSLLGVGVRTKIVVNVYAAALYAEQAPIKAATAAFKGRSGSQLAQDSKLFDAIANAPAAKQVLLTFARDVGAAKIAEALSAVPGASAKARAELEECLMTKQGDFKKGSSLALAWRGRDGLAVKSGAGATLCSFRDRALASGLLAMYLGKAPVSPRLKASVAEGVALLHAPPS
jgi:hypothetical protein